MIKASARPVTPSPMRRLVRASWACCGKGIVRDVDGVVEHPDRDRNQCRELVDIDFGRVAERFAHKARQIDGAQQTGAVRRQGLLAARIGGVDGLAVIEIIGAVDAVDEDHARLGIGVGAAHDLVPQRAGRNGLEAGAAEDELPGRVLFHRLHEGIGDQDREIEHAQAPRLALGVDEGFDIRVIATQRRHHRAAAIARTHDGAAHGVPHIHEGKRARRIRAHTLYRRALGAQRREIVADAAALLHGQRGFFQILEDAGHVVGDVPHDEAIEEGDLAAGAGPGQDAARRQEAEIGQSLVKPWLPAARVALGLGERLGHPPPAILDGLVHSPAARRFEPVFHVPDLLGEGRH